MSNAYTQLKEYVDQGKLHITYIDAPPRTISSALIRSLSSVYDDTLYEPFNKAENFDKACEAILHKVQAADTSEGTVNIAIKDMARALPLDDWEKLVPLVEHFAVIMRDPHLQMQSFIKRIANDMHSGQSTDQLSDEEVAKYAPEVATILKNGGQFGDRKINPNFEETSWGYLEPHIKVIEKHIESRPEKNLSIIPGFALRADPENTMRTILSKFNRTEAGDKAIASTLQWSEESAEAVKTAGYQERGYSGYTQAVIESSHFTAPLDVTPPLEDFPPEIQDYILNDLLPIYVNLLCRPENIGTRLPSELREIANTSYDGVSLKERNPVTLYAFLAATDNSTLSSSEESIKTELMETLKQQHPRHCLAMDKIDEIVLEKTCVKDAHEPASAEKVSWCDTITSQSSDAYLTR